MDQADKEFSRWRLKPREEKRFRSGHPWVYSNELSHSPKGILPGDLVELRDSKDQFLARGYGNPNSLIAFRVLSRDPQEHLAYDCEFLFSKLTRALELREALDLTSNSFRLCFGEADALPGLVIDRYLLEEGKQVFSVQAHTAGADRMLSALPEALERLSRERLSSREAAIIYQNNLSVRKREGLEPEDPRVGQGFSSDYDFSQSVIQVRPPAGVSAPVLFRTDLLGGQKTGFFLDQNQNVRVGADLFSALLKKRAAGKRPVRILDLFCYVGQWSSALVSVLKAHGVDASVTLVDASEKALGYAEENAKRAGAEEVLPIRMDIMKNLSSWIPESGDSSFDLVICDPPALIKGRKDLPTGSRGYLQLNTHALEKLAPGGAHISCSCSSLFVEEEFKQTLARAAQRSRSPMRWVAQGFQGPDHPVLQEFPEGLYLKAVFGVKG